MVSAVVSSCAVPASSRRSSCVPQQRARCRVRHLLAAAAPWQPGRGDINLGRAHGRTVCCSPSQGQASRLINGLLDGRSTVVRNYAGEGRRPWKCACCRSVSPRPTATTSLCGKLLPMNYDQVRQTQVGFPGTASSWMLGACTLDVILDYMKADPTVNHIELDGHSDNSGNRLTNRDLSRRRAWRWPSTSRPMAWPKNRSPCASMASATPW
jgi:hypothetical protein